jgi:hypothetical protein
VESSVSICASIRGNVGAHGFRERHQREAAIVKDSKHPEAGERTQQPVQRGRMRPDRSSQFLGVARPVRQLVGDATSR